MGQEKIKAELPYQKKKSGGRIAGLIFGILILAGVVAGRAYYIWKPENKVDDSIKVYVTNVGELTGTANISGASNRYSGIVETQKSVTVEKDGEMEVEDVKVKTGDLVKQGDVLFTYDTDSLKLSKSEKELEVEQLESENESSKKQIEQLNKEMQKVKADDKFQYEYQILQLQTTVKKNEYDIKSKNLEINELKKTINDNKVVSELDGIVKSINDNQSSDDQQTDSGFITIMAVGDYRIKGTVNEQNVRNISEGDVVTVHSRMDDNITWRGVIESIDTDHTESDSSQDDYYDYSGESSGSTDYPFYVELDSAKDLMMGQHVYIEIGDGQIDNEVKLALYTEYIIQEDGNAYVWAKGDNDRLEKRKVTLGEYDETFETYAIVDGLTPEDYIAWPADYIKEGMAVTENAAEAYNPEEDSTTDSTELDDSTSDSTELDDSTLDSTESDDSTSDSTETDDSTSDSTESDDSTSDSTETDDSTSDSTESDDSTSDSTESDDSALE